MNLRLGFHRISLLSFAMALLQGCAELGPQAPGVPAPHELSPLQAELVNNFDRMPRADFVKLGYAYADEQCDRFFVALQLARNNNSYEAAELAALNAVVTPGMGLLHAGAKAVGIVGGLFGFGTASLLNYSKFILLTEYNAELQDLVHSAKDAYKKDVADHTLVTPGMSLYDAYNIIRGNAWYCTLPGIDSLARSALSTGKETTAPVEKKSTADTGGTAAGAPLPQRFRFGPPPPPPPPPGAAGAATTAVIPPQITVRR